jgi:predicted PurR-regulated permease PerM
MLIARSAPRSQQDRCAADYPGPFWFWDNPRCKNSRAGYCRLTKVHGEQIEVHRIDFAVVVQVSLMFYFLFYFLRDRKRVPRNIRYFLPLSDDETDMVLSRVNETIQASLYGMLALSALQGVLGGLMYWLLGIPSPYFWALVMAAFAFVPVVDTIVVWIPAALYLGLEGRWAAALVAAGVGSLAIRVIINVLYPVLVKNRLRVPSVGLFIALLGGVILFGWSGLVLGPVVLTATSALLEICAKRLAEPRLPSATRRPSESVFEKTSSL